ncbi:hypothetical protein ACS3SW_06940 [Roseobacteraceae bacterium S113]
MMIRFMMCGAALVALAACQQPIPDSGAGVGFDRIDRQRAAQRDAQLDGTAPPRPALTAPNAVSEQTLEDGAAASAAAQNSGQAPLEASPSNPAPAAVTTSTGFSREQDFDAVSGRRSIEDDAERLASARAQYRIIEPSELPTRPGTNIPNIVQYAIQTNNPLGANVYRRTGFNLQNKSIRNCAAYASDDIAQEEFLMMGGPKRDRKALDPDGDGFACNWDPTPIRRAVQNASNG